MIAILLSLLLFICGLICTVSTIPPTKKLLALWFQPYNNNHTTTIKIPSAGSPKTTTPTAAAAAAATRADLRGVFATFDKNDDGYITRQELKESLMNIGISAGETDVADMVEKVDVNGDGLIDFEEFCELFDSISRDGDLKEAFDVFDGNKDGLITVEELGLVLSSLGFNEGKKIEDCKEMIRKVDVDGDGMVNFDEFKLMMKSGLGSIIQVS